MTSTQEVNNSLDEAIKAFANNIIPVETFKVLIGALVSILFEWERISHLTKNPTEEEMDEYASLLKAIKDTANDSLRFKKELRLTDVTTDQMYDYHKVMKDHGVDRTNYMIVPENLNYLDERNDGFFNLATELESRDGISAVNLVMLYDEVATDAILLIKLQHPS
ncbi:hypothetical protein [Gluconacetobacter tumulicola]|uniref:Uncharacterized protein n=1 Tax=Gluconacetobacter tumulicola TaxID=1017177 RepID=A0A7W4P9U9_9PROT|nr:hypothetical protein [Gluconacetobacter tumulicola]MBB2180868.1 hypothetical protein [Gluconacetobacter tumulicola]